MSLLQRVQQYLSGVNRTLRSIKITVGDHERRLLAVEAHTATGTGGLGVTHDTFLAVVQSQLDELATVRAVSGDPNNSAPPSYPPAYELPDIAGVWAGADTYANGDVVTVMQTGIKARPYAIVKGGGGGGVNTILCRCPIDIPPHSVCVLDPKGPTSLGDGRLVWTVGMPTANEMSVAQLVFPTPAYTQKNANTTFDAIAILGYPVEVKKYGTVAVGGMVGTVANHWEMGAMPQGGFEVISAPAGLTAWVRYAPWKIPECPSS
jgi:hypothetical protein